LLFTRPHYRTHFSERFPENGVGYFSLDKYRIL
jgi:hypothetical protein